MTTQPLTPLENLIHAAVGIQNFTDAARAAFSGQSGHDLLTALCAVAHPLFPPEGRDPQAVAREIGRREVVALLLRASGHIEPASYVRPTDPTPRSSDQPQQPAAPQGTPHADFPADAKPAGPDWTVTRLPDDFGPGASAAGSNDAGRD